MGYRVLTLISARDDYPFATARGAAERLSAHLAYLKSIRPLVITRHYAARVEIDLGEHLQIEPIGPDAFSLRCPERQAHVDYSTDQLSLDRVTVKADLKDCEPYLCFSLDIDHPPHEDHSHIDRGTCWIFPRSLKNS